MDILVIGTWREEMAKQYEDQAKELGRILAKRNHVLITSPSAGIQGMVAKSYKYSGGSKFIGFYPELKMMQEVGERVMIEPDEKIFTEEDYPIRNILQLRSADGVIVLTGNSRAITELISAVKDYELPVSYFEKSSNLIDGYLNLDPSVGKKTFSSRNISDLVMHIEKSSK